MKKVLKLMPDYQCYPLWIIDEEGLENIAPDNLDIPNELQVALHSWSDAYDNTLDLEDPSSYGFPNRESAENFYLEGRRLFLELKKHLGDRYIIAYISIKKQN